MREISSYSCLAFLPGPAWLLLNKICTPFSLSLYNSQQTAEVNAFDYSKQLSGRKICRWACPSQFFFLPSFLRGIIGGYNNANVRSLPSSKSAFISLFQCHRHPPKNSLSNLFLPRFLCGFCVQHKHRSWSDLLVLLTTLIE